MAINTSTNKFRVITTTVSGLTSNSKFSDIKTSALVINTSEGGVFYTDGSKSTLTQLAALPNHTHSGYATTAQLGNYLAKSGGTITIDDMAGFNIYRNNGVYSVVHFFNTQDGNMTDVGYLGAASDGRPVYINSGGNVYDLIHSNNIGTQSVASATNAANIYVNNSTINASFPLTFVSNTTKESKPLFVSTGKSLTFNPSTGALTATTFTGNLVGNADTATVLKTTRKIWGQNFNGEADISGNLSILYGDNDKFVMWDYDGDGTAGTSWRIGAKGTGSANTNYFTIQSGTSTTTATTWTDVLNIGQNDFIVYFTNTPKVGQTNVSLEGHAHSNYYNASVSRTKNTVLAAPNGTDGAATFRALVAADLPVVTAAKGGSGKTTLVDSANAYLNALSTGSSDPTDADYFISQYAGGGTTTTTYHRRPVSALFNYIKGKLNSTYLPLSGGSLSGYLSSSDYILGTGLIRVNASDKTSNFGYIRAETAAADASNRCVVHIGSNYGGSSSISNTVSFDAIGIYRTCVGIGGTFTYATLKSNYNNSIKLDVSGNVKATKFIGDVSGNASTATKASYANAIRDPDYYAYANRRTSANINFGADGALHYFLATGSITDGSATEGHILHFEWDNATGKYLAQLNVKHGTGGILRRFTGGTANSWSSWIQVLDASNYTDYCASVGHSHSGYSTTDTKNTAGSSNKKTKIFVVGAASQNSTGVTTYSDVSVYITDGKLYASNFITSSDERIKTNIKEVKNSVDSLGLRFVEFDYKDSSNHSAGHIAQEVKEVLPEFVHEDTTNEAQMLSIDYTGLHSVQIKALLDRIVKLEEEIKQLKSSNIRFK